MAPYISHRSTFIIFISINIVSVVCSLYEPIKENPVINNQKKFKYFNYLKAPNQYPNVEKLNVDQYYNAYYNETYRSLPDPKEVESYTVWKRKHNSYCDEEYVSHSHFETTYHIAALGNIINNLRECLKISNVFNVIQVCCNPNHTEEPVKCLELLDTHKQRDEATGCFEPFKTGVLDLFGKKEEHSKFTENLEFTKTVVGKRTEIAFGIATTQEHPDEFCDETFDVLLANYIKFTDDTTYTNDTDFFQSECSRNFEKYELVDYEKWYLRYSVFKGFDNFEEFSKQIKISLKFLEALEGKLVNNKELYNEYHKNPISETDYKELFTPLPLKHEDFYPLFFMRLKFLGYIPMDEDTWNIQMTKLRNLNSSPE